MKRFVTLIAALVCAAALNAQTALEIAAANESLPRPPASQAEMSMRIINKNGQERERTFQAYSRTAPNGDDYQMLVFTGPADVRGTRFLTIDFEAAGKDSTQAIYIPALRKVRSIGSSGEDESKTGAFLGSDFTYADLSTLDRQDFNLRLLGTETIDGEALYSLEFTAKNPVVVSKYGFTRVVKWINTTNYTTRRSDYFDASGKLLRRLLVHGQKLVQGKYWIFESMEMQNMESGGKTIWAFTKNEILPSIDERYFTTRYLERGRL